MLSVNPPIANGFERLLNALAGILETHNDNIARKTSSPSGPDSRPTSSTTRIILQHTDPDKAVQIQRILDQKANEFVDVAKRIAIMTDEVVGLGNADTTRIYQFLANTGNACRDLEDARYRINCNLFMLQTRLTELHSGARELFSGIRADVQCSPHPCCSPDEMSLIPGAGLSIRTADTPKSPVVNVARDAPENQSSSIADFLSRGSSFEPDGAVAPTGERVEADKGPFAEERKRLDEAWRNLTAEKERFESEKRVFYQGLAQPQQQTTTQEVISSESSGISTGPSDDNKSVSEKNNEQQSNKPSSRKT
jgi:hypothetical protein